VQQVEGVRVAGSMTAEEVGHVVTAACRGEAEGRAAVGRRRARVGAVREQRLDDPGRSVGGDGRGERARGPAVVVAVAARVGAGAEQQAHRRLVARADRRRERLLGERRDVVAEVRDEHREQPGGVGGEAGQVEVVVLDAGAAFEQELDDRRVRAACLRARDRAAKRRPLARAGVRVGACRKQRARGLDEPGRVLGVGVPA
jgi:hypothetical protein